MIRLGRKNARLDRRPLFPFPHIPIYTYTFFLFLLFSCQLANFVADRLNILFVEFSFKSLSVGIITPPGLISLNPADYGIVLNCAVNAKNNNAHRAAFDGATFKLRVNDTSFAAPAIESPVPAFSVEDSSDKDLVIPFRLTLDNSIFSKATLTKIVDGDKIPYRISADLLFNLVAPLPGGGLDTLGQKTMPINIVTDSLNTRPNVSSAEVTAFLAFLNLHL